MRLTILGSGTLIPVINRSNPGYLLDIGDETVLLDGGSGTLRQIARADRSIWEISRVFYSHFHIDHTNELMPLLFAYKYSIPDSLKSPEIIIHAHRDFSKYYNKLTELFEDWIFNENHLYSFQKIEIGSTHFQKYKLIAYPTVHTPQSLIYRFEDEEGSVFVYTGDTDYCNELIEASLNVDLLLIECSFPDTIDVEGHMIPEKITKLLIDAKPKQVLLTHIYPMNDDGTLLERINCPSGIKISVAEDLQVIEI